jgi:magnesium transporter
MPFVSELLGRTVADVDGVTIGTVADLIAATAEEISHPRIAAIAVKRSSDSILISVADVVVLLAPAIPLSKRLAQLVPYVPAESDVYLARDVLDKQIIDTDGMRVVRVNDLELSRVNGAVYVANVDVGGMGLLRRMGLQGLAARVAERLKRPLPSAFISWDDVELLGGEQGMRLRVPGSKIGELHPADLAEILSDMNRSEGSRFLESLDIEQLADTLEEVEPDFQATLVETMDDERVADVLEEMNPDEAADLLAELPDERSEDILNLMEADEAADVRKLLAYSEDSAGGIMTTAYVALQPDLTGEEALRELRENADEAETIFYIYVTDAHNKLVGVISLKDLVLNSPQAHVADFMQRRVISVAPTDSQEDVAQAVSKYNLLAVPVLDDQEHMLGIVTADDALDKIIPTAWKKRLPKLYH